MAKSGRERTRECRLRKKNNIKVVFKYSSPAVISREYRERKKKKLLEAEKNKCWDNRNARTLMLNDNCGEICAICDRLCFGQQLIYVRKCRLKKFKIKFRLTKGKKCKGCKFCLRLTDSRNVQSPCRTKEYRKYRPFSTIDLFHIRGFESYNSLNNDERRAYYRIPFIIYDFNNQQVNVEDLKEMHKRLLLLFCNTFLSQTINTVEEFKLKSHQLTEGVLLEDLHKNPYPILVSKLDGFQNISLKNTNDSFTFNMPAIFIQCADKEFNSIVHKLHNMFDQMLSLPLKLNLKDAKLVEISGSDQQRLSVCL